MTPSQVMWGVHDKIRAAIKSAREAVERKEAREFSTVVVALARDTVEMVYKEEKILFPLLLQTLTEQEWISLLTGATPKVRTAFSLSARR